MAYEVIHTAPQTSDFTGLSDHQEQTPGTFFGGKSVLHLHCTNAKLQMTRLELANHSDFAALSDCSNDWKEAAEITGMEFWVTSRYYNISKLIFCPATCANVIAVTLSYGPTPGRWASRSLTRLSLSMPKMASQCFCSSPFPTPTRLRMRISRSSHRVSCPILLDCTATFHR